MAAELGHVEEADRLLDELLVADGPEPHPGYLVPLSPTALSRGRAGETLVRLERLDPSPWRDAAIAMLRGDNVEAGQQFAAIGVLTEEARARLRAAQAFAAAGKERSRSSSPAASFFERVGATAYLDVARRFTLPVADS